VVINDKNTSKRQLRQQQQEEEEAQFYYLIAVMDVLVSDAGECFAARGNSGECTI
jgi:hypothetical protein